MTFTVKIISISVLFLCVIQFSTIGHFFMSWMSYVHMVLVHTRMCMNVVSFFSINKAFQWTGAL